MAVHSICNLKYSVSKKTSIVFHNGSNYDYHFVIKELAEKIKKPFTCLGENTEKYITFTVPTEVTKFQSYKVTKIHENGEKITKNTSYILQFIDSSRFMIDSSNFVNNLSEGIHRIKCNFGHNNKKCGNCRITYEVCDCFFEYANFRDDLIEYKRLCCKKNYQQKFDEKLKERFLNTYKFSNHDNNRSILLLRKNIYPYEYVDDSKKFNETSLTENKDFHIYLNVGDITDAD